MVEFSKECIDQLMKENPEVYGKILSESSKQKSLKRETINFRVFTCGNLFIVQKKCISMPFYKTLFPWFFKDRKPSVWWVTTGRPMGVAGPWTEFMFTSEYNANKYLHQLLTLMGDNPDDGTHFDDYPRGMDVVGKKYGVIVYR